MKYKYIVWKDKDFFESVNEVMISIAFGIFCTVMILLVLEAYGFFGDKINFFEYIGYWVCIISLIFGLYPILKFPFWIVSRIGVVKK